VTPVEASELLGVGVSATRAEIEAAFKARARRSHPDRFAGASAAESASAAAEFIRVTEARDVLLRGLDGRSVPVVPMSAPVTAPAPTRPVRRVAAGIWSYVLIVASIFSVIGGAIPLSPWNLVLLGPLAFFAISFARTGRRGFLIGTLIFAAANAVVDVAIISFGSLVALELLLAPVIALVVVGRGEARRVRNALRARQARQAL
jgi:hypothetical protein